MEAEGESEAFVVEKIGRLMRSLGADEKQAGVMARQLWKRSAQIAQERDVKQVQALEGLLKLMISGSQGMEPQDPAQQKD